MIKNYILIKKIIWKVKFHHGIFRGSVIIEQDKKLFI